MQKWYKLDNAAKIYPPIINSQWAALFRMSVNLTEEVDVEVLKEAQKNILKRFPSFAVRLKAGFFWYYFDHIEGEPPIYQDVYNPLTKINFRANNHFMYRLLYYKNRIAVEFFHSLTDGTGGMTFLMSLVNEYLHLKHGLDIQQAKYILNCNDEPSAEEQEDSFFRYYTEGTSSLPDKPSCQLVADEVPYNRLLMVFGQVKTEELKALAEKYDTSIGVLLASLLLHATYLVYKERKSKKTSKRQIKVCIPVNLRTFFPSKTLRNFSSFINPGIYPSLGDYTFEETLNQVKHFMRMNLNEKMMRARFSYNVVAEKNILIRLAPLFIKIPILNLAYYYSGDINYCASLSNLGKVELTEEMRKYIKRIDFMLGRSLEKRSNCACISYNGKTYIDFTRTRLDSKIEYYFFTTLVELGVGVYIASNGRS